MMFGKSGYLIGAITLFSSVFGDPFTNYADSKGQIETGYGADNATFTRYRPQYHFIGPVNWMNDPSAPYFDGEHYHVYYQHNPFDQICKFFTPSLFPFTNHFIRGQHDVGTCHFKRSCTLAR
jgi:hypothetical protein